MNISIKDLYDDWHKKQRVDRFFDTPWYNNVKKALDIKRDISAKDVLEIGCGRGEFACWLAMQDCPPKKLVAADFSSSAISIAHKFADELNITNMEWLVADILEIPFSNESFDSVISCETIEHVSHPYGAIRELARVLRPGGRLFLTTPSYFNLFGIYRMYLRLTGRRYQEVGQPVNKFVMLPQTISWIKQVGLNVEYFGSDDIVIPRLGNTPVHFTTTNWPNISKWFGLQSFIVAVK